LPALAMECSSCAHYRHLYWSPFCSCLACRPGARANRQRRWPDRVHGRAASFAAGAFLPDDQDDEGDRGKGIALSGAVELLFTSHLSVDLELGVMTQRYDRPESIVGCLFCNLSDRIDVSTASLSALGKAAFPVGRIRPYIGAGAGLFR